VLAQTKLGKSREALAGLEIEIGELSA